MKKFPSFLPIPFRASVLALSIALSAVPAYSAIDVYQFDNEQQEQQYQGLIDEFRCPKCQNQNLASSDSVISIDLKKKTYEMVKEGKKDSEIRDYMLERYGDFITYNPPVRPSTYILWYFPPILLLFAISFWVHKTARKNKYDSVDTKNQNPIDEDVSDSSLENTLSEDEQDKLQAILAKHESVKDDLARDKEVK